MISWMFAHMTRPVLAAFVLCWLVGWAIRRGIKRGNFLIGAAALVGLGVWARKRPQQALGAALAVWVVGWAAAIRLRPDLQIATAAIVTAAVIAGLVAWDWPNRDRPLAELLREWRDKGVVMEAARASLPEGARVGRVEHRDGRWDVAVHGAADGPDAARIAAAANARGLSAPIRSTRTAGSGAIGEHTVGLAADTTGPVDDLVAEEWWAP